jgi:hypothetical protein
MEYIDKIKKMLCKELDEYAMKSKLTMADLEAVHKLTDTVKNLDKIEMLEEESEGYSEARGGRGRGGRGRSSYGMSYDDDMMYSERRGRGRNARRDSMGRYSSEDGMSYDDYSEEGSYRGGSSYAMGGRGYSRDDAKDHMMNKLGSMMEGADPNEREILKDCMRKLERA